MNAVNAPRACDHVYFREAGCIVHFNDILQLPALLYAISIANMGRKWTTNEDNRLVWLKISLRGCGVATNQHDLGEGDEPGVSLTRCFRREEVSRMAT